MFISLNIFWKLTPNSIELIAYCEEFETYIYIVLLFFYLVTLVCKNWKTHNEHICNYWTYLHHWFNWTKQLSVLCIYRVSYIWCCCSLEFTFMIRRYDSHNIVNFSNHLDTLTDLITAYTSNALVNDKQSWHWCAHKVEQGIVAILSINNNYHQWIMDS